jgi:ribosome-binding protein aMBF1 (putative translation factor)
VRVGDYRIVFELLEGEVLVTAIDDRKDAYLRDFAPARSTKQRGFVEATTYARWAIGQNLKEARLYAGLTQRELAAKIGRAQSTVAMAERGKIDVSEGYFRDVLKACGIKGRWPRA